MFLSYQSNHLSLNNGPSNYLFCKSPHGHIDQWNTGPGSSQWVHLTLPWIQQPLCIMSIFHPSHLSSVLSFWGMTTLYCQWSILQWSLISYQELPMHTGEWSSISRSTTFYLQWYQPSASSTTPHSYCGYRLKHHVSLGCPSCLNLAAWQQSSSGTWAYSLQQVAIFQTSVCWLWCCIKSGCHKQ